MFTETEVALALTHRRHADGIVRDANRIIDGKDARIATLEAMLIREQRKTADLVVDRGRARNAVLAARIARKH